MLSDRIHVVNGHVIGYQSLQGAGGDLFGACGCEHKRQRCAGSGLQPAREGLCSLQAGQLHWPEAAPQVHASCTRCLQEHLHSIYIRQSHPITTQIVIILKIACQRSHATDASHRWMGPSLGNMTP